MTKKILDRITGPADIKNLSMEQLELLAEQIRERIIDVMSVNGGHLASNLGTVELSIAMHQVFNSPADKLIWDVSHQTYPHKLLTGRVEQFPTIRQFKGLCGFSNPFESEHDHFQAGHAGTALSLAMGIAQQRDILERQDYVIPIIGDATLTCGMALEALNNISRDMKRFIVVLNDNEMSISQNVGAITRILSRMLSNPTTNKLYQELETILSKIPGFGPTLAQQGHKVKESLKNLVGSGAFFEQFNLSYIGPVDGHNIPKLIEVFEELKDSNWPVIVHVLTNKGQGMTKAVENPTTYHGAKPFDVGTGKFLPAQTTRPTFPKVFGKQILEMAEKDPSIVAVTPAMSAGSCLDAMMEKFPQRCLDVGIAEAHSITYAGAIAYKGKLKVVASIYATFLQRAFDNLFHDVCLQELPVVFAIDRAGISGPDGSTHHGIYDISFLNAMPNMIIAQPRNGQLLRELFNSAFDWERPAAIRYPNLPTDDPQEPLKPRPLAKGEVLAKGKDLLIIGLGHMNQMALEVRELLKKLGVEATVMDPVFIKPLDHELICDLLVDHQKIVTIEEHSLVSGMGSIINNFLITQNYENLQVLNIGIPETFLGHGDNKSILNTIGLTPEKITQKICNTFSWKNTSAPVEAEVIGE